MREISLGGIAATYGDLVGRVQDLSDKLKELDADIERLSKERDEIFGKVKEAVETLSRCADMLYPLPTGGDNGR